MSRKYFVFCVLRNILKTKVGESGQLLNPGTENKSVFGLTLQKLDTVEELWLKDVLSCLSQPASGRTGGIQHSQSKALVC